MFKTRCFKKMIKKVKAKYIFEKKCQIRNMMVSKNLIERIRNGVFSQYLKEHASIMRENRLAERKAMWDREEKRLKKEEMKNKLKDWMLFIRARSYKKPPSGIKLAAKRSAARKKKNFTCSS